MASERARARSETRQRPGTGRRGKRAREGSVGWRFGRQQRQGRRPRPFAIERLVLDFDLCQRSLLDWRTAPQSSARKVVVELARPPGLSTTLATLSRPRPGPALKTPPWPLLRPPTTLMAPSLAGQKRKSASRDPELAASSARSAPAELDFIDLTADAPAPLRRGGTKASAAASAAAASDSDDDVLIIEDGPVRCQVPPCELPGLFG